MHSTPGPAELNEWFAFRVRPRHEKQVSISLREKGFVEFLPLYKSKRQWADRTKVVEMPLFPGYILLHHAIVDCAGANDQWCNRCGTCRLQPYACG
jgi:hypothetical protein